MESRQTVEPLGQSAQAVVEVNQSLTNYTTGVAASVVLRDLLERQNPSRCLNTTILSCFGAVIRERLRCIRSAILWSTRTSISQLSIHSHAQDIGCPSVSQKAAPGESQRRWRGVDVVVGSCRARGGMYLEGVGIHSRKWIGACGKSGKSTQGCCCSCSGRIRAHNCTKDPSASS